MIILDLAYLWWVRHRHPEWSILRLRFGYRAYRGHHDVHAGTLRAIRGHINACDALDKAAAS